MNPFVRPPWLLIFSVFICFFGIGKGSRVFKRSDDTNPLEAVVSQLRQDLAQLQAQVTALQNSAAQKTELSSVESRLAAVESTIAKKAALRAWLAKNITANAPIQFEVVHDEGRGYDVNTGIYTVPVSGWYSVDFQLYPHPSGTVDFPVDLHLNNIVTGHAQCNSNIAGKSYTCNSGLSLHMNAGDKLWLQSSYGGRYWHAFYDNVFSVLLVTPD